jgi:hypothetical protein
MIFNLEIIWILIWIITVYYNLDFNDILMIHVEIILL